MRAVDWRTVDAGVVAPFYHAETRHWRRAFAWETHDTWRVVEEARRAGALPGFLAVDGAGDVHGWTFCHPAGSTLQVGALVAAHAAAADTLLDAIVATAGAARMRAIRGCFPRRAGVSDAFARGSLRTSRYLYLSRRLAPAPAASRHSRAWREEDLEGTAALLASAYDEDRSALFAPDGSREAWQSYVRGLVAYGGCGVFDPGLTRVCEEGHGINAVALVSRIAEDTAHLVQLAVAPDARRSGIGARVLTDSMAAAARAGLQTMTLLVAEDNHEARRLYHRAGFTELTEDFVSLAG